MGSMNDWAFCTRLEKLNIVHGICCVADTGDVIQDLVEVVDVFTSIPFLSTLQLSMRCHAALGVRRASVLPISFARFGPLFHSRG